MRRFKVIAAFQSSDRGIGYKGNLPWVKDKHDYCFRRDMQMFKNLTADSVVIMGRKTAESIPQLTGRIPLIVSSKHIPTFDEALKIAQKYDKNIYVIGGQKLYEEAINHRLCKCIFTTEFNCEYPVDTYFPPIPKHFKVVNVQEYETYKFVEYFVDPREGPEEGYLDMVEYVLNAPDNRVFGVMRRYDLARFPLLTTKSMFWRGIVEELLFFLRGDTDTSILRNKGIHIWDGNTTREYLDSRNLHHLPEWDMGKGYGYQWRNFSGKCDQIVKLVNDIMKSPNSRRLIVSAWNPPELDEMAIPPCHILAQFFVRNNQLSCHLYQRSGDIGLGVPFNIASYSLLTHIIAKMTGLVPFEFIHTIGDAHIYPNHVDALFKQIGRIPEKLPKLEITKEFDGDVNKYISELKFEDFNLIDYKHHPAIFMKMVVT